jgi:hypothetical protein
MHPIPVIMWLLSGVFPLIAAIQAKKSIGYRILFFICGLILGIFLENIIIKTPPLMKMVWSGPDIYPIFLAFLFSDIIVGVLSYLLYEYYLKQKKNE